MIRIKTIVIDCRNATRLATFYSQLLGWPISAVEHDWVQIRDPKDGTGLSFQMEADYLPPVWPEEPQQQQKMIHLDFQVDDLLAYIDKALSLGAHKADLQVYPDVCVMIDPDGHPFCLFTES